MVRASFACPPFVCQKFSEVGPQLTRIDAERKSGPARGDTARVLSRGQCETECDPFLVGVEVTRL